MPLKNKVSFIDKVWTPFVNMSVDNLWNISILRGERSLNLSPAAGLVVRNGVNLLSGFDRNARLIVPHPRLQGFTWESVQGNKWPGIYNKRVWWLDSPASLFLCGGRNEERNQLKWFWEKAAFRELLFKNVIRVLVIKLFPWNGCRKIWPVFIHTYTNL